MTSAIRTTFELPATARPTVGDLKMSIVGVDHIGWLLCDGRALSTEEYRILFAVLGYRFGGSGDTFNLPNPQGRVLGCAGTPWSIGDASGTETHTLTTNELPPHNHDAAGTAAPTGPGYTTYTATGISTQSAGTHAHTGTTDSSGSHLHTGTTDGSGSHNHTYTDAYFAENAGLGTGIFGTNAGTDGDNDFRYRTAAGGSSLTPSPLNTSSTNNHTHTFTTTTTPGHTHTFLSDTSGSHTHAITDPTHRHQIASVGDGDAISLLQPTLFVGNLFVYSGRPFYRTTNGDGITPPATYPNVFPYDPDYQVF
jgi:microcystin-dependent protein